jgi:hypothetical protein
LSSPKACTISWPNIRGSSFAPRLPVAMLSENDPP